MRKAAFIFAVILLVVLLGSALFCVWRVDDEKAPVSDYQFERRIFLPTRFVSAVELTEDRVVNDSFPFRGGRTVFVEVIRSSPEIVSASFVEPEHHDPAYRIVET